MLARELAGFVPARVFDAHAHLVSRRHYPSGEWPEHLAGAPDTVGLAEYRAAMECLHPGGRTVGGLFFGLAFEGDRAANNALVRAAVAAARDDGLEAYGQLLVSPGDDPEWVRDEVRRGGFVGLKPYRTLAPVPDTMAADIEQFLPEAHVRVAHEEGLAITLHVVHSRALADPRNQATIRRYCETYPGVRMILAHAARGFNPWHTIEGVGALRGLDNVWFDTAAVTEAGAIEAIVDVFGPRKLLYGTDFPISHLRGRCVAIGDGFHWLYEPDLAAAAPVLVGLEALRSLRLAVRRLRLTDREVECVFADNALALFDRATIASGYPSQEGRTRSSDAGDAG